MNRLKLISLFLMVLVLLTFAVSYGIYKLLPFPGAVCVAIAGIPIAAIIGFYFGKQHGDLGIDVTGLACSVLAFPLCAFTIATATQGEDFSVLSGLGFWSIPCAGIITSVIGSRRRTRIAVSSA
jgi:carbon starvation protein CstA